MDKWYSFTAGQGTPYNKTLEIMSKNILPSVHKDVKTLNSELTDNMKKIMNIKSDNIFVLPIAGTGTAATDILVSNVVGKGDKVIISDNGFFSKRIEQFILHAGGIPIIIHKKIGEIVTKEDIEIAVNDSGAQIIFLVHGETSSGLLQPLKEIGNYCAKNNLLFLVDCATTISGVPFDMEYYNINGVFTVSQKCLACSPGMSILAIDSKYLKVHKKNKNLTNGYYFDIDLLVNCWYGERKYHHTHPYTLFLSLNESIKGIIERGIDKEIDKYTKAMHKLIDLLKTKNLKSIVENDVYQLPTLISVYTPESSKEFANEFYTKYGIYISTGIGDLADKVIRIGLFGKNKENENLNILLSALDDFIS